MTAALVPIAGSEETDDRRGDRVRPHPRRVRFAECCYQRLHHRTGEPVAGVYEFTFRDSTHRQRWQTAKGDTLADAKAERAEMVARLHRGERVERTKRTVSDAAQAWLERGRGQRGPWDPVTRERYERAVRRHVLRRPAAAPARRGEAARPDARPRGGVVAAQRADAGAGHGPA